MAKQRDALHPALWMSLILKGCPTPGAARSTRTDSHLLQAASAWDGQAARSSASHFAARRDRPPRVRPGCDMVADGGCKDIRKKGVVTSAVSMIW